MVFSLILSSTVATPCLHNSHRTGTDIRTYIHEMQTGETVHIYVRTYMKCKQVRLYIRRYVPSPYHLQHTVHIRNCKYVCVDL